MRAAPWISLRDEKGCVYLANLVTRETRWLPPRTWMQGWISCPRRCSREGIEIDNPLQASRRFTDLLLPREIARKHVEGGAPYMHEHGEPQYAPDKDDSEQTYPHCKRLGRRRVFTRSRRARCCALAAGCLCTRARRARCCALAAGCPQRSNA